jgi:site-specific DNA recombinase
MGKLARAKEGLYHGGPYAPIGYNYEGGRLLVNEYEAAQVRKIYEWYLDGMSPLKIAARLRSEGYTNRYGSWSERGGHISVLNVLSGEVYLGTLKYGEVVVENAHEAIVEREQFERVRVVRSKRHEIYGDSAYVTKYLLSGMVFCGGCGARYFVKHNYGGYKYYCCYSRARTAKHMIKSDTCENKNWPLEELGAVVEKKVKKVLNDSRYVQRLIRQATAKKKPARGEEAVLRDKIAGLEKQIGRFMDLYQNDTIPADVLSARIEKLYREKVALDEQLSSLVPPAPKVDYDAESITEMMKEFALYWDDAEPEHRRRIIQTMVRRIVLDGEDVNIEWSFFPE